MNVVRNILRMVFPAAAIIALLTGIAAAQFAPSVSLQPEQKKLTPEEAEKQKAIDQAYKAASSKIPEKNVDDPWAGVRPPPPGPGPKKKQQ